MLRKHTFQIFAVLSSLYLIWRLSTQIFADSSWTWVVFAIEVATILELGFITYAQSNSGKATRRQNTNAVEGTVAILDARETSIEAISVSLYSLQESSEFSEVLVLTNDVDDQSLQLVCEQFSISKIVSSVAVEENSSYVAWINPGDVVLGDMVSQCSAYLGENVKLAMPKIALWSNAISNASEPRNVDPVSETVSEFISQKHGDVWAGQTAVFETAFFSEHVANICSSNRVCAATNDSLSKNSARAIALNVIGVEQHDGSATARIVTRVKENQIGFKGILSKKSSNRLASFRYASRPVRAFRTVSLATIAVISVLSGTLPFPRENVIIFAIVAAFYSATIGLIRLGSSHSFDQISRVRHSFSNLGSDLTSLFTRNVRLAKFVNTYAGPALTVCVATALVARCILNFGDKSAASSSASAILFGLATLGVMLYGLELVGFRQRRNTLRRIVSVNAKFGRRAIEIADLSPNDCGVISNRMAEIGSEEIITLGLPTAAGTKEISVHAKVVNSAKVGVSYRIGFIFDEISAEDRAELTRFCTLTYPQYALRGVSTIVGESSAKDVTIAKPKKSLSTFSVLKNQTQRPLIRVAAILALFAVAAGNLPPYSTAQAATSPGTPGVVAGIVYQDFNANGKNDLGDGGSATDVGMKDVFVKATCESGSPAPVKTNNKGEFSISSVSGKCRVEIVSGVPTGMKSSAVGIDSNSLVQFVSSGTANVQFGLHYPSEYCQNNPKIVVTCFGRGNVAVDKANKGAILTNTWKSTNGWSDVSTFGKVGTVYGLAYKTDSKDLFSAAYLRRKAGLGELGIGGIYKTSMGTSANTVSNWLDLEDIAKKFGETLGANPRPLNQSAYDLAVNDQVTEQWVGRRGIGDIDISPDNKTLYATNLNTGSVYAIDIADPLANPKKIEITGDLLTSESRKCSRVRKARIDFNGDGIIDDKDLGKTAEDPNGVTDVRVFGLGVKATGEVYVGAVCSGQSTQSHKDLFYYVFKFNPDGSGQKLVSTHDLQYERSKTSTGWNSRLLGEAIPDLNDYKRSDVKWEPWQFVQQTRLVETLIYPYPSISDITFDGNDLIVGMRDIFSDTVPPNGLPSDPNFNAWGSSHGDLIRLCGTSGSDQYVLENNRSCPGEPGEPGTRKATGPATVPEYGLNGDPTTLFPNEIHTTWGPGGAEWFRGDDPWDQYGEGAIGAIAKPAGFNEFVSTQSDPANYPWFFGQTSAFSAGTRWFKSDSGDSTTSNIVYDIGDSDYTFSKSGGLGDLEALCDEAKLEIGNRVWSDDNGNGIQDPSEAGISGVKVELVNSADGSVRTATTNSAGEYKFTEVPKNVAHTVRIDTLNFSGIVPTTANANNNASDSIDSDGIVNAHFVNASMLAHSAGDNDHTFDFGFKPVYALGNLVFNDVNNNGVKGTGEAGVDGIAVKLLDGNGVATDKTATTSNGGKYYFSNLDAGSYMVEITAPAGYISSTGNNANPFGPYEGLDTPSPDTLKTNDDDNGTTVLTNIRSKAIVLGAGRQAVGEPDGTTVNAPDTRNDYTVDFGIFQEAKLGDKVWLDSNSNGIQDVDASGAVEPGVLEATVTLWVNSCKAQGNSAIATTSTNAQGNYVFTGLAPGDYYVHFQLPNGKAFAQALVPGNSTVDSNANATTGCSEKVTLTSGAFDRTIDAGSKPEVVPIDLKIVKSIDTSTNPTYLPGTNVTYILTVTNNGPATAKTGFTVEDQLPAALNFVSASGTDFICPTPTGKTVTCTSGHTLAAGAINTIVVVAQIDPEATVSGNAVKNIATVKPGPGETTESIPLGDCSDDGSNQTVCNNRYPLSFPIANGASIGNRVWVDANKNGVQDQGEVGLVGIPVSLKDSTGAVIKTMNTGADGIYLFTNLAPGSYSIVFGATPGYTLTTQDKPNTSDEVDSDVGSNRTTVATTLTAGENDLSWDMGVYSTPAELGNKVWFDSDADGRQDDNEAAVPNVKVYLYGAQCSVGSILKETTTDNNGNYLFSDLAAGTYTVKFDKPLGSSFTGANLLAGDDTKDSDADSDGCSAPVTLVAGDSNLDVDAGIVELASIGDFVWVDWNRNGIQDGDSQDEWGIEGVHVFLLDSNGNRIPNKELVTDVDGFYLFDGLLPGTYSVEFDLSTLPVEVQISPDNQGNDDSKDTDADPNTGITGEVTVGAGEQNITLDLGVNPVPASLGDTVFEDKNKNGIQDEGDIGIEGVTVLLFDCDAEFDADPIDSVLTGEDGFYEFVDLEWGSYFLFFETPTGMTQTTPYVGSDESLDSDVEQDGYTTCVDLPPGYDDPTIDAGFFTPDKPPVNVGGVVITKPKTGSLPFTGSESSQLVAFAASLIGAGLLLVGFFTQRKKKVRFF